MDKRFERPEFSTNPVLSGMVGPHPKFMNKAMSALTVHTLDDEVIDLAFGSRIQWDLEGVDVPDFPQDQFALIAGIINRDQVVHGSWTNLILIGTMIVAVFAAAALFTGITWEKRSRKKYIRELKKKVYETEVPRESKKKLIADQKRSNTSPNSHRSFTKGGTCSPPCALQWSGATMI